MKRFFVLLFVLLSALAFTSPAQASVGDTARAEFANSNTTGNATITEEAAGSVEEPSSIVTLTATLSNLRPGGIYYIEFYRNNRCDRNGNQVTFGSFFGYTANSSGVITTSPQVESLSRKSAQYENGIVIDVGNNVLSAAVRRADVDPVTGADTDQDGDGIRGRGDVVATPGSPGLTGLVACDGGANNALLVTDFV